MKSTELSVSHSAKQHTHTSSDKRKGFRFFFVISSFVFSRFFTPSQKKKKNKKKKEATVLHHHQMDSVHQQKHSVPPSQLRISGSDAFPENFKTSPDSEQLSRTFPIPEFGRDGAEEEEDRMQVCRSAESSSHSFSQAPWHDRTKDSFATKLRPNAGEDPSSLCLQGFRNPTVSRGTGDEKPELRRARKLSFSSPGWVPASTFLDFSF